MTTKLAALLDKTCADNPTYTQFENLYRIAASPGIPLVLRAEAQSEIDAIMVPLLRRLPFVEVDGVLTLDLAAARILPLADRHLIESYFLGQSIVTRIESGQAAEKTVSL
jgi:hypothetical protein